MRALAVLLLAVLIGAPESVAAQQPERLESPDALRARLDSLRPLLDRARADLEARKARQAELDRRAAEAATTVDTFTVGGARVLTPPAQSRTTRDLFESIWQEHFAHLGPSPSLASATLVFQWADDKVPIHIVGEAHRLHLDTWTPRSRVEAAVRDLYVSAMSHDLHEPRSRVGAWMAGSPLSALDPEEVYRRIATMRSRAARACLAGDVGTCVSALGLEGEAGVEELRAWYAPDERRSLVAARFDPRDRRSTGNRSQCVVGGDVDLCDRMLLGRPPSEWAPLDLAVRRSFAGYALDQGGVGAWARLIEDPRMAPAAALEHASGRPLTDLAAGWRSRILENRPDTHEGLIPGSGRAMLWTLLFAALALRSTRWRLG